MSAFFGAPFCDDNLSVPEDDSDLRVQQFVALSALGFVLALELAHLGLARLGRAARRWRMRLTNR